MYLNIRSRQMYVVKSFAMFSVICAHMKLQLEYGSAGWLSDKIISLLSMLGVPIFFICSGYYYNRYQGDTDVFWKKKTKTIIVPWLLWGSLTYFVCNFIWLHKISMRGLLEWVLGYGSLYYFVAVLLFCFVIFGNTKNKTYLILVAVISILANMVSALNLGGVLRSGFFNFFSSYWAYYLVWPIFFEIGMLWHMNEKKLENIYKKTGKMLEIIVACVFSLLYVSLIITDTQASYWGYYSFVFEVLGFGLALILGRIFYLNRVLEYIGKNTFFIYLTHMQVVGMLNTRLPQNGFFYLIKPLIGLGIMVCVTVLIKRTLFF